MEIFLDGVSNENIGAYLLKKPAIPSALRRVSTVLIPGSRHGSLTQNQGWDDVSIECEFMFFHLSDYEGYNDFIRKLNGWCQNANKLQFSDDPEFYRLVKQVTVDNTEPEEIEAVGSVKVTFVLDPFWYQVSSPLTLTKSGTVYNPGTESSEPLISVYGNGTLKLTINSSLMTMLNVKNYLTIDCRYQTITNGNDEQLSGTYPLLNVGNNQVSFGQGVTKVSIDGRWVWL